MFVFFTVCLVSRFTTTSTQIDHIVTTSRVKKSAQEIEDSKLQNNANTPV